VARELLEDGDVLAQVVDVLACAAGAKRGAEDDVPAQQVEDQLAEVDRLAVAAAPREGAHGRRGLVAHGEPRLGAAPAEELRGGEIARLAPQGPVLRERHVGVAVGEVRDRDGGRPVREGDVLRLQHLARVLRRGHHEDVPRTAGRDGGAAARRSALPAPPGLGVSADPSSSGCR